jgi:hypothetical protein
MRQNARTRFRGSTGSPLALSARQPASRPCRHRPLPGHVSVRPADYGARAWEMVRPGPGIQAPRRPPGSAFGWRLAGS